MLVLPDMTKHASGVLIPELPEPNKKSDVSFLRFWTAYRAGVAYSMRKMCLAGAGARPRRAKKGEDSGGSQHRELSLAQRVEAACCSSKHETRFLKFVATLCEPSGAALAESSKSHDEYLRRKVSMNLCPGETLFQTLT
jgi:hypothetical protein